jgi:MbtH protein
VSEREEMSTYSVVVNHEEQYSIWPAGKENALGWRDAGFSGTKAEALAFINEHWTDMRPLSLRQQMERAQQPSAPAAVAAAPMGNPPVAVAAVPTPVSTPTAEAEAQPAKQKRGWFGRQRDEQPTPVPVGAAEAESATETKTKRGWFGRR